MKIVENEMKKYFYNPISFHFNNNAVKMCHNLIERV